MPGKHHTGKSLKPIDKFKYSASGHVPMKKPRRTKKHHGRGGGMRG